ncbi:hypothetical protein J2848_002108 [Azospirillum lipoferum]|uniref:Uncharacterized protein n=1 Tax=Azospirillum lipoferum TaxID=193 RepID=A0A5A9GRQ0_AZOLI|nr:MULTISPECIES: hypothetical protein [Azospirillum]KAA0596452.1 hypothetical protein FZ942_10035 [Azospirillum lipoferum]MCP1610441.1 hypothetical protein [Azospirillum lipoferum]MDW5538114.1 hypothetical protein [Azospirillum sp. NL1]
MSKSISRTSKIEVIKDALTLYEGNRISRWQVINRLIHLGLSADDANIIADHGSIPAHILSGLGARHR